MTAINRKLVRDLWAIKGQALAISLVIASGVLMFVTYLSTFQSLRSTLGEYYHQQQFAEVFANLKRAPVSIVARVAEIPGVAQISTRVVVDVSLDIPGLSEPAMGRLLTMPASSADLNNIFLRQGRVPVADLLLPKIVARRDDFGVIRSNADFAGSARAREVDEILVSEAFAEAHGFGPGSLLTAVINGRRRQLQIVGVALSPEYIYTVRPGELMPDDSRFAVLWMGREALASAYDMRGGFNEISLRLSRRSSEPEVIAQLNRILEPYGVLGAYPRRLQTSHWYLESELAQLQTMGVIIPVVFLAVAAFLLNVVMTRIVAVQRQQIAALKALGYGNGQLVWHYLQWALVIAVFGAILGTVAGMWLGRAMTTLYNEYFRFPVLRFELDPIVVTGAWATSLGAAVVGAFGAVNRTVQLSPAEAMRPASPARYHASWFDRSSLGRRLGPPTRMILRSLQRQPIRALVTMGGVACAVALMVVGTFMIDSLDVLVDVQFNVAERQDVTVSFVQPVHSRALHELMNLPGVLDVEPMRVVPVRLRAGHRTRQTAITGLVANPRLNRVIDASQTAISLPPDGLVLSSKLAEILAVNPGETVRVEVLEGARPESDVAVVAVAEEFIGANVYMEAHSLQRLLGEGERLSGAFMTVDPLRADALYARLKAIPGIAGVSIKRAALDSFAKQMEATFGVLIFFNVLFAGVIAFGVVYNTAQISLSERSRELASLRVLGFTRAEISYILLGELGLVTAAGLPVGAALGYVLAAMATAALDSEIYRFPLVVTERTVVSGMLVVAVASLLSALVVRRRLDQLDLVAVLKTGE